MKQLLQLSLLLLTQLVVAQNLKVNPEETYLPKQKHFTTYSFQVEELCYLRLQETIPESQISFYNSSKDAKYLCSETTDALGGAFVYFTQEQMPAFVLNHTDEVENQPNVTAHFEKKEFILKNIEFKRRPVANELSFEAIADKEQFISFQIIQIDKEGNLSVLHEGFPSDHWRDYNFGIDFSSEVNCQIRFFNEGELRYSQPLYLANSEVDYVVYPTITEEQFNLDLSAAFVKGSYLITNVNGQVQLQGELTEQYNSIAVQSLEKGTYIVQVELNGIMRKGTAFVKR